MSAPGHKLVRRAVCLHGVIKTCRIESANVARRVALYAQEHSGWETGAALGSSAGMPLLRLLKGSSLIAAVSSPHGKENPEPHIGKCSYCDRVAFAFSSLALVIVPSPRFTLRRLPGELLQGIAQGFDTPQSAVCLGVHPTLKQHGRGSSQSLQTACVLVTLAIIPDLGQQSRSQTFACARQAFKDLMIFMSQKKGVNLLIILSNLFNQRQQLTDQYQQQTRFGTSNHSICLQMWLVQLLDNAPSRTPGVGMLRLPEHLLPLLDRCSSLSSAIFSLSGARRCKSTKSARPVFASK
jgi:hypothetical protein